MLGSASNLVSEIEPGRLDDFVPRFRAVQAGESRRGVRLEQIYWNTLKQIATERGVGLGGYIEKVSKEFPDAVNITSILRVKAARWLLDRVEEAHRLTGHGMIDSLVQACPSPAFALQEDKRILVYNQSFLNYIQSRFSRFSSGSMAKGLRLSLDVQIGELVERLRRENKPTATGFVLGIEEQRLRGSLTTVLAPVAGKAVVIGYVTPG